jgi:hypothetical protein
MTLVAPTCSDLYTVLNNKLQKEITQELVANATLTGVPAAICLIAAGELDKHLSVTNTPDLIAKPIVILTGLLTVALSLIAIPELIVRIGCILAKNAFDDKSSPKEKFDKLFNPLTPAFIAIGGFEIATGIKIISD